MKPLYRNLAFAGLLILAVFIGVMLGQRGAGSGLWADLQHWLGKGGDSAAASNDPALLAKLPVRDPTAGLPECPLNDLLKPGLTPQEQTGIVGQMLMDYWTTVHSLPNGTWQEVCAQLAGANSKKLEMVPKGHPALGKSGFSSSPESPGIHLHVISSSGCAFQLIYAGPDKEPYTADDLIRNYPPDLKF